MRVFMHHIALICAIASWYPNGSCQICCETETIKICKFHQKCTKDLDDDERDNERDPNQSNPHKEASK